MTGDTPETEERYGLAAGTGNLKITSHTVGAADILVAMAWSRAQLGAAMIRVLSNRETGTSQDNLRRQVLGAIAGYARKEWMPQPESTAARAMDWWMNSKCQTCQGRKWELQPGRRTTSTKRCKPCAGTGMKPLPAGQEYRKLATYIEDCIASAGSWRRK